MLHIIFCSRWVFVPSIIRFTCFKTVVVPSACHLFVPLQYSQRGIFISLERHDNLCIKFLTMIDDVAVSHEGTSREQYKIERAYYVSETPMKHSKELSIKRKKEEARIEREKAWSLSENLSSRKRRCMLAKLSSANLR